MVQRSGGLARPGLGLICSAAWMGDQQVTSDREMAGDARKPLAEVLGEGRQILAGASRLGELQWRSHHWWRNRWPVRCWDWLV